MFEVMMLAIGACVAFFMAGELDGKTTQQRLTMEKCVAYYSDMPYNKVTVYCTNLLEFKKETK